MLCANDWQAALVPVYLKQLQSDGQWLDARISFIVHNMVFQGRFPADANAGGRLSIAPDLLEEMKLVQTLKIGRQKKASKGNLGKVVLPCLPTLC